MHCTPSLTYIYTVLGGVSLHSYVYAQSPTFTQKQLLSGEYVNKRKCVRSVQIQFDSMQDHLELALCPEWTEFAKSCDSFTFDCIVTQDYAEWWEMDLFAYTNQDGGDSITDHWEYLGASLLYPPDPASVSRRLPTLEQWAIYHATQYAREGDALPELRTALPTHLDAVYEANRCAGCDRVLCSEIWHVALPYVCVLTFDSSRSLLWDAACGRRAVYHLKKVPSFFYHSDACAQDHEEARNALIAKTLLCSAKPVIENFIERNCAWAQCSAEPFKAELEAVIQEKEKSQGSHRPADEMGHVRK